MSSNCVKIVNGFQHAIASIDFSKKTVLDLGCGFGRWGHFIRTEVDKHGNDAYLVGCDAYRPYFEETRKYNPYDDLVVCDIRNLPFKKRSFNIIIAFEVIEHMIKAEAINFISKLEDCAIDRTIISTPYGYYPQDITRDNVFEIHKSRWYPKDFEKNGYETLKCGLGISFERLMFKLKVFDLVQKLLHIWTRRSESSGVFICANKKLDEKWLTTKS